MLTIQFQLFFYSWGTDSLVSWFKILPNVKTSFIAIDMRNHGKSDSSWKRWDVRKMLI